MDFKEFLGKVIDDHVKENDYGQEMEPQVGASNSLKKPSKFNNPNFPIFRTSSTPI